MAHASASFSQQQKVFFACIAILIVPLSGLATDIYAPSLPSVAHYFQADKSLVQLTMTVYMLGMGIMQLFAGGISDSFGRRKPFIIANAIFLMATLLILCAQNIYQLLALRFIQGGAVAAAVVPMRSIIPDLFEGRKTHQWMNYMVMAWSIGPIIAPAIGGYFQHYLGWKSNFCFLALYALITGGVVYWYLPETSEHRHPFQLLDICERYKKILTNLNFVSGLLINALLYSMLILFTVAGPFLIQTAMHYSAIASGNMALLLGLAWFLGTLANRFLIHISLEVKAKVCLTAMLTIATLMLIGAFFIKINIYLLLIPVFLMSGLGGIVFPNYAAKAIMIFPKMTASANALYGGGIFVITAAASCLAASLKSTTLLPLAFTYVGLIGVSLLIHNVSTIRNNKVAAMT